MTCTSRIGISQVPYKQEQIVIPPTNTFCDVRTANDGLFRADGGTSLSKSYVFDTPPKVEVTG